MISKAPINPDTPISDLLADYPQVSPVFLRRRMACVGCSMSAFETIASAAAVYRQPLEVFLLEIRAAAAAASVDLPKGN